MNKFSATLASGTVSITINSVMSAPYNKKREKKQLRGLNSIGEVYSYTKSPTTFNGHNISFTKLSITEVLNLEDFHDSVDGTKSKFQWTDDYGVVRTVRFANDTLEIAQKGNYWTVTIGLEEEQ